MRISDWSSDVCSSDLARQCQLAFETALLRVVVQALDEMIEPAFADGDGVLALDPVAQLREVFRTMFGEEHRMQAVGGEQPVRAGTDVAQLRPASGVDRGHDLEIGRDTSELQSLMRHSYAVFCLKKKQLPTFN